MKKHKLYKVRKNKFLLKLSKSEYLYNSNMSSKISEEYIKEDKNIVDYNQSDIEDLHFIISEILEKDITDNVYFYVDNNYVGIGNDNSRIKKQYGDQFRIKIYKSEIYIQKGDDIDISINTDIFHKLYYDKIVECYKEQEKNKLKEAVKFISVDQHIARKMKVKKLGL